MLMDLIGVNCKILTWFVIWSIVRLYLSFGIFRTQEVGFGCSYAYSKVKIG